MLPPYCAVILWLPAASVVVLSVAAPLERVALPMLSLPSKNITDPEMVPAVTLDPTVAVSVTEPPTEIELADAPSDVDVPACATVTTAWAWPGWSLVSPA